MTKVRKSNDFSHQSVAAWRMQAATCLLHGFGVLYRLLYHLITELCLVYQPLNASFRVVSTDIVLRSSSLMPPETMVKLCFEAWMLTLITIWCQPDFPIRCG